MPPLSSLVQDINVPMNAPSFFKVMMMPSAESQSSFSPFQMSERNLMNWWTPFTATSWEHNQRFLDSVRELRFPSSSLLYSWSCKNGTSLRIEKIWFPHYRFSSTNLSTCVILSFLLAFALPKELLTLAGVWNIPKKRIVCLRNRFHSHSNL